MKLNPRQRPKSPPMPDIKSTVVIRRDLSNSDRNVLAMVFLKLGIPVTVASPKYIFTTAISSSKAL